jgi:hypothetical protein
MAISLSDWTFTAGGPVVAYNPETTSGWIGLAINERVTVSATGETLGDVYVEIRNAANTTTIYSDYVPNVGGRSHRAWFLVPGLTPGTVYTARIRASGSVSGLATIGTRQFRYAIGEITYPVSLGTDPFALSLAVTLVNANQDNYAIHYAPADGPLSTDVTGAFSTSPPTSFPVPAYVHIRVRVQNLTKFARMELSWRAS